MDFFNLGSGFSHIFGQTVSVGVKKLSNTNSIASRYFERQKPVFPVYVRRSKISLLKQPDKNQKGTKPRAFCC